MYSIKKLLTIALILVTAGMLYAADLEIISAQYGNDTKMVDVTLKVKDLVVNGAFLAVYADNKLPGEDPVPHQKKKLIVKYKSMGKEKTAEVAEKRTLVIFPDYPATEELKVYKAFFGARGKFTDVTERVQSVVKEDTELRVTNEVFGDPIKRVKKNLIVIYSTKGKVLSKSIPEKKMFSKDKLTSD